MRISRFGPALVALAVVGSLALSAQPAGAAPGGGSAAGKPAPGPKAAATSRISGTVTDGSGHGYALFAKVEVVDRPDLVTWTDAVTGRYALDVVPGTYRVKVTSAYPGYVEDVGDVDASADATHNARLTVAPTCQAAGYQVAYGTPLVKEGFDAEE